MSGAGSPSSSAAGNGATAGNGKRDHDDDSESDDRRQKKRANPSPDDGPITDPDVLLQLEAMQDHSKKFDVHSTTKQTFEVMQWHYTNLRRDQLIVPQNYYQRDPSQGWGSDQQARYLKTVYQGQAATPLVVNVVKAQARVMDGGHRLEALKMFTSNNVGMQVGSGDKDKRVFYCQLTEDQRDHFDRCTLQVQEFKGLSLKSEIEIYTKLNSGTPFTSGEKLYASHSLNPVTKLAKIITEKMSSDDDDTITQLCKIMGKDNTGDKKGRKNETLVAAFFIYHLDASFRKCGEAIIVTMGETFIDKISTFNKDELAKETTADLEKCKGDMIILLHRTLDLYTNLCGDKETTSRPFAKSLTGTTPFRRILICLLAVADIPQLDTALFKMFLTDLHSNSANDYKDFDFVLKDSSGVTVKDKNNKDKTTSGKSLHRIVAGAIDLKREQVALLISGYSAFCARLPPPPPPPPSQ